MLDRLKCSQLFQVSSPPDDLYSRYSFDNLPADLEILSDKCFLYSVVKILVFWYLDIFNLVSKETFFPFSLFEICFLCSTDKRFPLLCSLPCSADLMNISSPGVTSKYIPNFLSSFFVKQCSPSLWWQCQPIKESFSASS